MLLLLSAFALATPRTPVTVTGQLGGAVGPPSLGGFGSGDLAVNFGRGGLSVGGREGYLTDDGRSVGAVEVQGRFWITDMVYTQGGFFHFHETPGDVFMEYPVLSVIGSAPGIRHRSGVGGGMGVDFPLEDVLDDRLGAVAEFTFAAFPDPLGPTLYVLLDVGFSLDIGKPRAE